ncbi:CLK4-associating serine/arginine rich protein [Araneus ventricosus]|uniref:CLK4-associating serine/arginine rich protein n=1 Tax=Araneus ventricosus TaxID=182803 RepID=A0A4Y2NRB3_ARAVE|nr:CLK4-associating serine/arginine rich protein [Araneus ventricosus]
MVVSNRFFSLRNEEPVPEDRQACYERYRTLVQNDFLVVNEDKFLHQIFIEERFGIFKPDEEKKKPTDKKAAIGYVYEDSTESPQHPNNISKEDDDDDENDEEKEEDLSDIDLDVTVDVNMLTPAQCEEMNLHSLKYGMVDDDFITYLHHDKDEAEQLKLAREIEEEKAMYSGRKSRRERRALREKKLAGRKITSPPSYAARESPTYTPMRHSTSKSRSRSPPEAGKIMFITSFGGEGSDGEQLSKSGSKSSLNNSKPGKNQKTKDSSGSVIGPQLPSKNDDEKSTRVSRNSSYSDSSRSSHRSKRRPEKRHSRHHSRHSSRSSSGRSVSPRKSSHDKKRSRRSRTRSRSRSRSYSVSKSRSRSRSRHQSRRSKAKSASRSRSKSASKIVENKSESPQLPPPPIKSYYRHSLSKSNSEVSEESEEDNSPTRTPQLSNISGTSRLQPLMGKAAPATKTKMTPQERLKRKMQLALKKQYKADKQAQLEKTEKQLQERQVKFHFFI